MAGRLTLAERYRRHRLAFELALELGITPKEAEAEMDRRAAIARCREAEAALAAKRRATVTKPNFENWNAPWMHRD